MAEAIDLGNGMTAEYMNGHWVFTDSESFGNRTFVLTAEQAEAFKKGMEEIL